MLALSLTIKCQCLLSGVDLSLQDAVILGPHESAATASRSVQPFCTAYASPPRAPIDLPCPPVGANVHPSYMRLRAPTNIHVPNCMSIVLSVFAGLVVVISRQTHTQCSPKEQCIRWGCTLAPLGEYDGSIFAADAMRPIAIMFYQTLVFV